MAALVKPFLLPAAPRALLVPVESPTGASPPTCAGGVVIRGAPWPHTPCSPWGPRGVTPPILPALWAPVQPGVGHPSSEAVRQAHPCPATRGPHQPPTVAPLLGTCASSGMRSPDPAAVRPAPAGSAPVFRKRPRAIRHVRASATLPIVRRRALPGPHRVCYPGVRRRSGGKRIPPHALATALVRLAPWPAWVIPRARRRSPRWEGGGVRPAHAPTCVGVCRSRQAQHALTKRQARCTPRPRTVDHGRTCAMTGS